MRSKLGGADLSKIWVLSDSTKSGQLFFPEFALAMYLCNLRITGRELPPSCLLYTSDAADEMD